MGADGGRTIEAAGCVVWRRPPAGPVEVLIVHRPPPHDDWSLPKGKLHRGESHRDAALREVHEETGVRGDLGDLGPKLAEVRYVLPNGDHKHVRYWAMEAAHVDRREADDEVDGLRWVPTGELRDALTWDSDRTVVDAFLDEVPPVTSG